MEFTWEEGRRLASASHGSDSVSYQYNADGLRTGKTVNGVTTRYDLEDGNIAWQTDGTNTVHYSYDANGDLVLYDAQRYDLLLRAQRTKRHHRRVP